MSEEGKNNEYACSQNSSKKNKNTSSSTKRTHVLSFPIHAPFDVVYRKDSPAYPVGPHSHNGVELYFTLSDLPDVLLNDTVSEVPAGTLIILPPFCVHQLYHKAGTVYERYILSINTPWLDAVFCDNAAAFSYLKRNTTPLLLTPDAAGKERLLHRYQVLLSLPERFSPNTMANFFHFLAELNETINRLAPESNRTFPISATQKSINDMIAYIQEHISEPLTVTKLAKHFYLHPDYLSRLFKKHAHTTVSHYITLQKIATAQSLLRDGRTVAEVWEALGYSSYAYFFKTFQRNTGISPSKYRAQYFKQNQ